MTTETFPLTYFTHKIEAEFDDVLFDLQSKLVKDYSDRESLTKKIASLFVDDFKPSNLIYTYNIALSPKLQKAIQETLQYAIDTEMLIKHIYDTLSEVGD